MSDECLMKQETSFSSYAQCQAVMRKFSLVILSFAYIVVKFVFCVVIKGLKNVNAVFVLSWGNLQAAILTSNLIELQVVST